jgi:hypothetical protein
VIRNPFKWKVAILLAAIFVLGAATAVTFYAYGDQVIEQNQFLYMVSHTEYRYGEMGQIIVRLVDYQGDPISVTNCTVSILYPDKSFFIQGVLMLDSGNISGDHYYNFTTPSGLEGIYEYQATCNYPPNKQKSATNSFHLSSAFNTTISLLNELNLSISSDIEGFRQEVQANFSQAWDWLSFINITTVDTYDYLTGTLATNVNSILAQLGIINATVNRIEQNTVEINTTTQQILQNQEDEVFIDVYSG